MVTLLSSASTTVTQTALWVYKKIHAHLGILEGVQENGEEAPLAKEYNL